MTKTQSEQSVALESASMPPVEPAQQGFVERLVPFREAAPQIWDADLLLFRGCQRLLYAPLSHAIEIEGRGVHSHAAKAIWWHDAKGKRIRLFCIEMVETETGGRVIALDTYLKLYLGRIDVFRANAQRAKGYNRQGSARWTIEHVPGTPYAKAGVVKLSREFLPGLRWLAHWLWPPNLNEEAPQGDSMVCSEACDAADHLGGKHKPVRGLASSEVRPPDLAKTDFYEYLFTLAPDGAEVAK